MSDKPELNLRWSIDLPDLRGEGNWHVEVIASHRGAETVVRYGWTALWGEQAPSATVAFAQAEAASFLRILYSAVTALHDPAVYLQPIGLNGLPEDRKPKNANLGSVRDHGAMMVWVDWEHWPAVATVMIYPSDPQSRTPTVALLGVQSIDDLAFVTEEAFRKLDWVLPGSGTTTEFPCPPHVRSPKECHKQES